MNELVKKAQALKTDGHHIEALKIYDEAQQVIKESVGENSELLTPVYSEIAILCNVLSMAHLQKEDFKLCGDLVK